MFSDIPGLLYVVCVNSNQGFIQDFLLGGGGGGGDTWQPMQAPPPPIPSARSYHTQGCDQLTCFDMFRFWVCPTSLIFNLYCLLFSGGGGSHGAPPYETLLTSDLCSQINRRRRGRGLFFNQWEEEGPGSSCWKQY